MQKMLRVLAVLFVLSNIGLLLYVYHEHGTLNHDLNKIGLPILAALATFSWYLSVFFPVKTKTDDDHKSNSAASGGAIAVSGKKNKVNVGFVPPGNVMASVDDYDQKVVELHKAKENNQQLKLEKEELEKKLTEFKAQAQTPEATALANTSEVNLSIRQALLADDINKVIEEADKAIQNQQSEQLQLAQVHHFRAQGHDYKSNSILACNDYEAAYLLSNGNKKLDVNNVQFAFDYANALYDQNHPLDAKPIYEQTLDLYRDLTKENPDKFNPYVATTLNNLAILEKNQNNTELARQNFNEALDLYRELAKENPDKFNPDVAMTLNNLANLEDNQNNTELARQYYHEALMLFENVAIKNPKRYNSNIKQLKLILEKL